MGETPTRQPTPIERFLVHLEGLTMDRGVMADLRHGLSKATEYRAWSHVAPWCTGFDHERERRIWLTVAAGFAIHQRTSETGNMGTVARALATGQGRDDKGLATFDARFRRFLSCSSASEVCDHLGSVLRTAEGHGVPVNFVQLFDDLVHWGDKVKVRWATEYWGSAQPEKTAESDREPDQTDDPEDPKAGEP